MADAITRPLPEIFHDWVSSCIDEEGIRIPHALVVGADGKLTAFALHVPPADGYRIVLAAMAREGATEAIFAFDRFARPGQGTTLGDLMAGHHLAHGRTRPFIIEYRHDPRIVKPIDWNNAFWNAALLSEIASTARSILAARAG